MVYSSYMKIILLHLPNCYFTLQVVDSKQTKPYVQLSPTSTNKHGLLVGMSEQCSLQPYLLWTVMKTESGVLMIPILPEDH